MTADGMWRTLVMLRDQGCIAPRLDPEAGPCYGKWGDRMEPPHRWDDLEADYIEVGAHGPRHLLAKDHVALCPGHHRGTGPQAGAVWAKRKGRRAALRAYLDAQDVG